jgi:hypothetical protein
MVARIGETQGAVQFAALRDVLLANNVALAEGRTIKPAGDDLRHIMAQHHPYGVCTGTIFVGC